MLRNKIISEILPNITEMNMGLALDSFSWPWTALCGAFLDEAWCNAEQV
jgi:hypothetical protein